MASRATQTQSKPFTPISLRNGSNPAGGAEFEQLHDALARVQRELTELREAERRMRAQQAVTRALAETSTLAEAAPKVFDALCSTLGGDWAELWRVEPGTHRLRCIQTWQPETARRTDIPRRVSRAVLARGEGIAGTVWARNKPLWITDVSRQSRYQYFAATGKFGLRTVFAFPIRLNREVLGVITIFSREVRPPDKHLLRLLRDICSQIGQVMGRRRAERRLLEVIEREQQRIGQDLHDGLCQQLTGIAYMASDLQAHLAGKSDPAARTAARIAALSQETAVQARQVARGLNPVKLGPGGLSAALTELVASVRSLFSISCRFHCRHPIIVRNHETAVHLYRIAQEAIHNAISHGRATDIVVSLARAPNGVVLSIKDNGRGFSKLPGDGDGMGLENMNYRARTVGAHLTFARRPGGGAVVTCAVPSSNERTK